MYETVLIHPRWHEQPLKTKGQITENKDDILIDARLQSNYKYYDILKMFSQLHIYHLDNVVLFLVERLPEDDQIRPKHVGGFIHDRALSYLIIVQLLE